MALSGEGAFSSGFMRYWDSPTSLSLDFPTRYHRDVACKITFFQKEAILTCFSYGTMIDVYCKNGTCLF